MSDSETSKDINDIGKGVAVAGGVAGGLVTFGGTSTASVAAAVGDSAGGAIIGALEGAEAISAISATGEIATVGAGAVLGTTAAAAALGLGTGLYVGNQLEEHYHAGSDAGDWAYEHSDHSHDQEVLEHADAAEQAWDEGHYGTALVEGAETIGSIAESLWDGLTGD
jgi:hypothetical protein